MSDSSLTVRRVVAGHEGTRAVVVSDELLDATQPRPGDELCVIWANDRVPVDNSAVVSDFPSTSRVPGGAAFRVIRYGPGRSGAMHRTQTVDYGVVISGSITLVLDDGAEAALHAGDVFVQRGTIHNWLNRSAEPCTIAVVLIDAEPIRELR